MHGNLWAVVNGSLVMRLDGQPTTTLLDGTSYVDGITPIYRADNMQDGDHQLVGQVAQLRDGTFDLDYFEYAVPLFTSVTRMVS